MSIASRQIKTIVDKIIGQELQKGTIPTVKMISSRINSFFKNRIPGQPTMQYRPAKYREKSSSADWNDTVEEIYTDLNVLYDETVDQSRRILNNFDYAETEKRKIERQINSLEDRIKELLLLSTNSDGYTYSVYDSFRDLSKIDLESTNCWIDLGLHQVTPMYSRIGNTKADLSSVMPIVSLETKTGIVREQNIESIFGMLDDNVNTSWIAEVVSSKEQKIQYQILLDVNVDKATRISIDPQVADNITIALSISEDMYAWRPIGTKVCQDLTTWDFAETPIKAIKIDITKHNADTTVSLENGKIGYVYYIGIKNIDVLKIGFENRGSFYSVPLSVTDRQDKKVVVNKISLEVEEETTTNSKIRYYIGFENGDRWVPISHINDKNPMYPTVIDMKKISNIAPITNILAKNAVKYEEANGLSFFCILNKNVLPENQIIIKDIEKNTPALYKGVNQWLVEKYRFQKDIPAPPKITDWINLPSNESYQITTDSISSSFVPLEESIQFNNGPYTNSRYITNIYVPGSGGPQNLRLSMPEGQRLFVTIYVNQMEVFSEKVAISDIGDVTLPLASGWNNIQVLTYEDDPVSSQKTLFLSENPKLFGQKARAQVEPMTLVSEFDLLYNVLEKDTDKYCISDNNDVVISEYLKNQEAIFEFSYKYAYEEAPSKIILRADFYKDDGTDIPPKLKYYKIRISQ